MNGKTLTYDDVFSEVLTLEKAVASLKTKLLKFVPAKYGSAAWWEESDRKALKEYSQGKYKSFKSVKALMQDLNS